MSPRYAAAGEPDRVAGSPVIAPGVTVDFRCAAEFAVPDDERVVEQAAILQVRQQRRDRLVGLRHKTLLKLFEVLTVRVPGGIDTRLVAMPIDSDKADTRFEHPPGEKDALAKSAAAVAVPFLVGLCAQIERIARPRRSDEVSRLLIVRLHRANARADLKTAYARVKGIKQTLAGGHADRVEPFSLRQHIDFEIRVVGMLVNGEGIVLAAEDAGKLTGGEKAGGGADPLGEANERRHARLCRQQLADDRADVRHVDGTGPKIFRAEPMLVASEHPVGAGGMVVVRVRHRTDEGDPVHLLADVRQQFGNLDARHVGRYRLKFAPNIVRGQRLHIPKVLMSRAAPHEEEQAPLGLAEARSNTSRRRASLFLGRQQGRQAQSQRCQCPYPQHGPPAEPVAHHRTGILPAGGEDFEHGWEGALGRERLSLSSAY